MQSKHPEPEVRLIESNKELEAVIALNLSKWGADYFGTEQEAERITREQYNDPKRHTLVAIIDGKVVGTAGLVEHDVYNIYHGVNIRDKNLGYCSRLIVREDFRKQGIAKKLLIARESLAAKLGFTDLFLVITETRESDLCRMHLAHGWKIDEERIIPGWGTCLILTKSLGAPRLTINL